MQNNNYDLIKFEDGEFSLDVNVSPNEDTVWLTANQMAMLFNVQRPAILKHISNILSNKELDTSTCSILEQVQMEGNRLIRRKIKYYNLDMILAVGYRVNSKRGILFRKWATSILKQYMLNGYSINEKRCLECQENLVSLNNKVNTLLEHDIQHSKDIQSLSNPTSLLSDKLFYEGDIFDAYSYVKQLFLSANSSITLIDGYVDLSVLDMLIGISLPITIYTYPSSTLTNQDIDKFNINHNLTVIKTNQIHDRFIIIDDTIYLCGASIKDVGKKRFVLTKIDFINTKVLIKNIS
ncbi:MAG: virulence RhuM family protein [Anaeroplasmataceae bacterium]|nr:virulence RhuM family protein [Anaeroplasmataceae bacterium]